MPGRSDVYRMPDGWGLTCPGYAGDVCGDPAQGFTFTSTGWPTRAIAEARLAEHWAEHEESMAARIESRDPDPSKVARSLEDFRQAHGLRVNAFGMAVPK